MGSKIVVVGAGPGGLASAMLLSKAGAEVTVLEKMDRVGGRTSTMTSKGFKFDLGPTFFLYPQVLQGIYKHCGFDLEDDLDITRLDPHYRLTFEDRGELTMRSDIDQMSRELAKFSELDGKQFVNFMKDNRRKFNAFKPILERHFSSPMDLANPKYISLLPLLRTYHSVEGDLRRFFKDESIRLACAFQSKYLGMSPFSCPSIFTILSFLEYEYGIFHPKGGCAAISEDMAEKAGQLGADVRVGEAVEEIKFDGKKATGVMTAKGNYPCDALFINADFANAMTTLVPNELRRRWTDEKLANKKFSCSTFMLYLGLEGEYPQLQHHNIFLSNEYRQNLEDIEDEHKLSDNPSFYVCNPCRTDPSMAPEGKTALYVLVPVTHQHPNVDWNEKKQHYRDLALKQMRKIGLEDIDSKIEFEHVITPQTWEEKHSVYKGAVFNLAHSLSQMLYLRPQNKFEDLESVYLVGGGTHPGSGLPVIFESAKISSALAIKNMGLN